MSSVQGDNDKKDNMESDIMFGLKTLTQIPMQKVTGENTDKVKKDKKGNPFALVMESTQSGLMKGDTIRPGSAPMVDGYIMGGDYNISKKSSKNYKID